MKSMTGFGLGCFSSSCWTAKVEITSINRKQVEIITQLPKAVQTLESRVRQVVLPYISRGRLQISVQLEKNAAESLAPIRLNTSLARSLENAFLELSQILERPLSLGAADFLKYPGLLEIHEGEETDQEEVWGALCPALEQALMQLDAMRKTEGVYLKEEFFLRLKHLESLVEQISTQAQFRPIRQRELLMKRLSDLGLSLECDDERLAREIALFADRCDLSEEVSRLQSHFVQFQQSLESSDAMGRALDFLCQELFREFNTIASKANDARIAQSVVAAKTELEKLREQLQNIE